MNTTDNTTASELPGPPTGWYTDEDGFVWPELPAAPTFGYTDSLRERDRIRQAEENLRSGGWTVADELDARCDAVHRMNQYYSGK